MAETARIYSTRRHAILVALADKLKEIDGTGDYLTNLYSNVHPYLKFWDEINQFPAVHLNTGPETRDYQGGGYKDRYLSITIRCYVNEENAAIALDALMEDIETVLDENSQLLYTDRNNNPHYTHQISVSSITTDEGVLEPLGVGEMNIEVHY